MRELTPEELLDHAAKVRENNTAVDIAISHDEETEERSMTKAQQQKDDDSFQQQIEELESKQAAEMPEIQRGRRYEPPGAFTRGVRANAPQRERGGEQSVLSAATVSDPPIQAVLVEESSSDETSTINDIYTAEPIGSMILKDPFFQRRCSMALICLCSLVMIAIISVSVYFTVSLLNGGNEDSNEDSYYTRHAVVFGTNARDCDAQETTDITAVDTDIDLENDDEDDSDLLTVEFDCDKAKTGVRWHSPGVRCQETDTKSFYCEIAISGPVTAAYVALDCERPPGRPALDVGESAVSVTVQVTSDCTSGDRAFARLLSFCDDPEDLQMSGGTTCNDSTPVMDVPDGCERTCINGCTFGASADVVCSASTSNDLAEDEFSPILEDIQSDIKKFLQS